MIKLKDILLEGIRTNVTLSDMFYKDKVINHGEEQIFDGPLKLFQNTFIKNYSEKADEIGMVRADNDFGD